MEDIELHQKHNRAPIKYVERLYGVTKRCKLFVYPDRISIRFKDDLSIEEMKRIEDFLIKAAALVDCEKTVRGHLARHKATDTFYIVLQDGCGSYSKRITEMDV